MRRRSHVTKNKSSVSYSGRQLGHRIPLTALIHTIVVAEHLNFRHAATALGISQSSVSARVKALEEELGIRLFERHARGVRLTEAGRSFVDQVSMGVKQIDYAVKTAGMIGSGETGRIRIAVPNPISTGFLAKVLRCYRQEWPGIEVELFDGEIRDAMVGIREGRLDIAFVAAITEVPDCHSRPLWAEPLFIAMAETDARASTKGRLWQEFGDDLFLVRNNGTGPLAHDHIVRRFRERGLQPNVQRCDVDRCTLLSMVAAEYGITLVSEATSKITVPGVVFIPILDEPEPIRYGAVWSPHNSGIALRNLLNLARKHATL